MRGRGLHALPIPFLSVQGPLCCPLTLVPRAKGLRPFSTPHMSVYNVWYCAILGAVLKFKDAACKGGCQRFAGTAGPGVELIPRDLAKRAPRRQPSSVGARHGYLMTSARQSAPVDYSLFSAEYDGDFHCGRGLPVHPGAASGPPLPPQGMVAMGAQHLFNRACTMRDVLLGTVQSQHAPSSCVGQVFGCASAWGGRPQARARFSSCIRSALSTEQSVRVETEYAV